MKPTNNSSGTALRIGASHDAPMDPIRKYAAARMRYAIESARRNPKPVGCGAAEDRQKPHHAAEDSRESSGLLGGKVKLFLQVKGERSESRRNRKGARRSR